MVEKMVEKMVGSMVEKMVGRRLEIVVIYDENYVAVKKMKVENCLENCKLLTIWKIVERIVLI